MCLCTFGRLPQREQPNHPAAAYATQFEPVFPLEQPAEYPSEQFQQQFVIEQFVIEQLIVQQQFATGKFKPTAEQLRG